MQLRGFAAKSFVLALLVTRNAAFAAVPTPASIPGQWKLTIAGMAGDTLLDIAVEDENCGASLVVYRDQGRVRVVDFEFDDVYVRGSRQIELSASSFELQGKEYELFLHLDPNQPAVFVGKAVEYESWTEHVARLEFVEPASGWTRLSAIARFEIQPSLVELRGVLYAVAPSKEGSYFEHGSGVEEFCHRDGFLYQRMTPPHVFLPLISKSGTYGTGDRGRILARNQGDLIVSATGAMPLDDSGAETTWSVKLFRK